MSDLWQEQIAYYRARAGEYDQWFLREGRYNRGPDANAQWFREAGLVEAALETFAPSGRVLELACGTGLWTRHLVRFAESVTALDASPEVLAINHARVADAKVRYVEADLLGWTACTTLCSSASGCPMCRRSALTTSGNWSRSALRPEAASFLWTRFMTPLPQPQTTRLKARTP
jgi:SAM-dependent methyltransferase